MSGRRGRRGEIGNWRKDYSKWEREKGELSVSLFFRASVSSENLVWYLCHLHLCGASKLGLVIASIPMIITCSLLEGNSPIVCVVQA